MRNCQLTQTISQFGSFAEKHLVEEHWISAVETVPFPEFIVANNKKVVVVQPY
jgi:hypothetical protein